MYYVLFNYTKGRKKRDFQGFRSDSDVVNFLHEKHKEIEVYQIIETVRSYHLGLVVTEELIKSVLEPEEEPEPTLPDAIKKVEERKILAKNKEVMERGEAAIAAAEKDLADKKKNWELCSKCGVNKVAPWNKKGICSECQCSSEGKRKYTRRKS